MSGVTVPTPTLVPAAPVGRSAIPDTRWEALPFRGARGGSGPGTWGQRLVWRDMRRMPPGTPYNVTQAVWIPDGADLPAVRRAVVELVERYEALRTVFQLSDDGAVDQRVVQRGEVLFGIWAPHGDPAGWAAQGRDLDDMLVATEFSHGQDIPFRVLVMAPAGRPTVAVVCATHLAADLQSTRRVADELVRLLTPPAAGTSIPGTSAPGAAGVQPLDMAAFEATPRGRAISDAAVRYLRAQLSSFPRDNFNGARHTPATPRFQRGIHDSAATRPALATVAARYRVSTATVALAVGGALLGTLSGSRQPAMLLVLGNRTTEELRASVGTLTQHMPVRLDLTGDTFADVLRATWSVAMRTYRHGRFDPTDGWQAIADIEREHGEPEIRCFFNDMRAVVDAPDPTVDAAALAALAAGSTFSWIEGSDRGSSFFLELGEVTGAPEQARWTLLVDSARVPLDAARRALSGIDELLIALAQRDVRLSELPDLFGTS